MAERPVPTASDVSGAFWEATRNGQFLLQHDPQTGRSQFFPRPVSVFSEAEPEWRPAAGTGRLVAVTTCRVAAPGFEAPYLVGIVQLDEGPRVFARLINTGPDIVIGQEMRLAWETVADGVKLYAFEPDR